MSIIVSLVPFDCNAGKINPPIKTNQNRIKVKQVHFICCLFCVPFFFFFFAHGAQPPARWKTSCARVRSPTGPSCAKSPVPSTVRCPRGAPGGRAPSRTVMTRLERKVRRHELNRYGGDDYDGATFVALL